MTDSNPSHPVPDVNSQSRGTTSVTSLLKHMVALLSHGVDSRLIIASIPPVELAQSALWHASIETTHESYSDIQAAETAQQVDDLLDG